VDEAFWERPELAGPLAARDVAALFRALQGVGFSQRTIARLTRQQQSEISEILAGRQVRTIELVERIADGLLIPRRKMRLADTEPSATPCAEAPATQRVDHPAAPDHAPAQPTQPSVFRWTGIEIRMLRLAMRMSVREFSAHLGVSDRMVSKWEAGGASIVPRHINQAALDTCLARAAAEVQARFVCWPGRRHDHAALLEAPGWVLHLPVDADDLATAFSVAERVVASVPLPAQVRLHDTTLSPARHPSHRYRVLCSRIVEPGRPCRRAHGHTGACA
jgi:transcriptional regulator with XRE-family HTH domain